MIVHVRELPTDALSLGQPSHWGLPQLASVARAFPSHAVVNPSRLILMPKHLSIREQFALLSSNGECG